MDLLPSEEQRQIVSAARTLLDREFPLSGTLGSGADSPRVTPEQLARIAALGWLGIGLPDDYGGVGYGLSEEALLFTELGRSLMPPSLLGSALGARVAAAAGEHALADAILCGSRRVVLGTPMTGDALIGTSTSGTFATFEATDDDLLLLADPAAAVLLAIADLPAGRAEPCIDPQVSARIYTLADCTVRAALPASRDALFLRGSLLVSAMLLGIAEATLQRSVEYARTREQYGRPIGSFQSIKHYCADMAVRCEAVRAMVCHASITLQQGGDAGTFDTHTARALAADAAQRNANTAVQIHGGMGYTEEMDIHLFVKRVQLLATLFGSARHHLRSLLALSRPD